MTVDGVTLSSEQLWNSAAVTSLVDVIFIVLLLWRIKPALFRELKWTLVGAAMLLWTAYGIFLLSVFWEDYYRYLFPVRWQVGMLIFSVPFLYGFFAWGFHWLSLRARGNPILIFCLLGGLESVLEHLWGLFGLKIAQVPMLQQASPLSMLAFAFPEYILYWCLIITVSAAAYYILQRLNHGLKRQAVG